MRKFFVLAFLLFPFISNFAQTKDEAAIREVLSTQVSAWNAGNVGEFMQGYWQSDSLMFIGKSGITYGWQQTLENYKKNYPDKAAMGKLTFNLLQFKPLSPFYFFVIGKWHLQRSVGDLEGHGTLLFKKINGKWFIVAEHSR